MFQENPIASPVKVGTYHELAEAIRRGAKEHPRKAVGRYCVYASHEPDAEVDATCALGAAVIGSGGDVDLLIQRYKPGKYIREVLGLSEYLIDQIISWNDTDGWSREQIANELCIIG